MNSRMPCVAILSWRIPSVAAPVDRSKQELTPLDELEAFGAPSIRSGPTAFARPLPGIWRAGFEVTMERVTDFRVTENEVIALNN